MKISTWNLMRPNARTTERNNLFQNTISQLNSDILILTETNAIINPGQEYFNASTLPLISEFEEIFYEDGENRVSIFSKFPLGQEFTVYDPYTSVCREVITPLGSLIIYATIIGVTGGKDQRFQTDIVNQKKDIARLAYSNRLCLAGDYNISFAGFPYPSKAISSQFKGFLNENAISVLTEDIRDIPDHISLSSEFIKNAATSVSLQAFDKSKTDHGLVSLTITELN